MVSEGSTDSCLFTMPGGMWGGVHGALPMIKEQIEEWSDRSHFPLPPSPPDCVRNRYAADLKFLERIIWPDIQHRHLAHDSYCCTKFPNTRSRLFPFSFMTFLVLSPPSVPQPTSILVKSSLLTILQDFLILKDLFVVFLFQVAVERMSIGYMASLDNHQDVYCIPLPSLVPSTR